MISRLISYVGGDLLLTLELQGIYTFFKHVHKRDSLYAMEKIVGT